MWEAIIISKDFEGATLVTCKGERVQEWARKALVDSGTQPINIEVEEKRIQAAVHL